MKASRLKVYQMVATSFACVAICSLIALASFVVIMDLLKYGFGIDPVRKDLERNRKKKARKAIAIRFLYVNVPMKQNLTTNNAVPVDRERNLSDVVLYC